MNATDDSTSPSQSPWIEGLVFHGNYAFLPAGCWAFQLANTCIAISLFQSDVLVLRFMLFLSAIFFILFGGICLNMAVDTIAWNVAFGFIHVRTLIPLILDRIPPKIDPQDREVYNKVFMKFGMPLKAFKILIDASYKRKSGSGDLLGEGKEKKLLLMRDYNGCAMVVKKRDAQGIDRAVTSIPTHQLWCGLVCYIQSRKSRDRGLDTTGVAQNTYTLIDPATAEDVADRIDLSDGERLKRALRREELNKQGTCKEASYYEWTYENLNRVFQHAVHGDSIRNVIDATLFESCMAIISSLDDEVVHLARQVGNYSQLTEDPAGGLPEALCHV